MHSGENAHDRIAAAVELLERHRALILGAARRVSLCTDDADDALQRSAEILITKAPPLPPERLVAWMVVVTRREALAMRRSRERLLGPASRGGGADDAASALEHLPSERPGVEELLERRERVAEARALLASLKADERAAIALKAGGYSYREICELRGWSYTKVNRCLAEGRAALRRRAAAGDAPRAASSSPAPAGRRGA